MTTKTLALNSGCDPKRVEPANWLSETVSYTVFNNKRDTDTGSRKRIGETYGDFIAKRLKPRPQTEKDGLAIVCATFLEGLGRKDEAIAEIHFIQLDFDNTSNGACCANPVTKDKIEAWLKREGWAGFIYETFSNTADWPKLRLVLFLTKPIRIRCRASDPDAQAHAALYKRFYHYIAGRSGFDYDKTCASLSRLFYLPAYKAGCAPSFATFVPGGRIDVEAVVAALPSDEPTAKPRVAQRSTTPERQAFDRMWTVMRPHLLVAEFLDGIPDWGLVSGENGKAQGRCPWQDEHNTADAPGATPAYAYDADVAEHGVATVGCQHNGCKDKTAGDFVFELMHECGFDLAELRDFLSDAGKIAFDAARQSLPPSKAELEEAFSTLAGLVARQARREALQADAAEAARLERQLEKLESNAEKARRKAEKAVADVDKAQLAEDEAKAVLSAAEGQLKPTRLKRDEKSKREAAYRSAATKYKAAEQALSRAEIAAKHATADADNLTSEVAQITEKIFTIDLNANLPPDQTADITAASVALAKRLAVFEDGVDREAYIEKLAAMSGQTVSRVRSTLRAEQRHVEARAPRQDLTPTLETFNERFCLARVGKASEIAEKPTRPGEPYTFLRLETFRTEQAPERRLADQWLEWQQRDLRTTVCFKPHTEAWDHQKPGELNLWTGFPSAGSPGDWGLLRTWMWEDACHRNPLWFAFLMCWLADIIQDPGRKKGSALVLKSAAKGTGKSHLASVMERLLGRYASAGITSPDQVTGKFNAVLAEKLLVILEEAFFAGSHAAVSALKAIITSPTVMIERKGVDPIKSDNYCRVLIATNQAWAVNTDGTDERRYFVLDVSDRHAKDRAYWSPLVAQMETEAGLRALLSDLERVRRPDFVDLRNPPQTPWLADQALHSLPGEARWLHHVLTEEMMLIDGIERSPWAELKVQQGLNSLARDGCDQISTAQAFAAAREYVQRAGIKSRLTPEDLGRYLAGFGVTRYRPRTNEGGRAYCYKFQDLEEMRAAFTAKYGVRFDAQVTTDLAAFGLEDLPEEALEAWRAYGEGRAGLPDAV